jgi:AcrR family transcriptional regulator
MSSDQPDTRHRILKASLELLEAGQGQGVRMADVAKRAGVSRQAVYLHFESRAELLIQTTLYLDDIAGSQKRLVPSREATTGVARLDAFIEAWTAYLPIIYPSARALLAMRETDEDAAHAWDQRMRDMREGCEAAVTALQRDGQLNPAHNPQEATDLLWMLLSVRNWEQLTRTSGWCQGAYAAKIRSSAHQLLVMPKASK